MGKEMKPENFWAIHGWNGFYCGTSMRRIDAIIDFVQNMDGVERESICQRKLTTEQKAAWGRWKAKGFSVEPVVVSPRKKGKKP